MTLTKDRRHNTYQIHYKDQQGKTRSISTKETDKEEAKKVAKQSKIQEIEQAARAGRITKEVIGRIVSGGKTVTMAKAIPAFGEWLRTIGRSPGYLGNAMQVVGMFANDGNMGWKPLIEEPVTEVNEKHIHEWINAPGETKASWRRVKLVILNRFFEFCAAKNWTFGNPAKLVRVRLDKLSHQQKEKRERNPFTDEEIDRLLDSVNIGEFWFAAIALARDTGLRLGDIAQLEWETIGRGKITVWTDKRDKRVSVPLTDRSEAAVNAMPRADSKYIFPEQREMMTDPKRRANLSTYFRRICEKCDIKGKTFHDLRASFVSDCVKRGIPMPHIAKAVGHSSIETTRGYLPKSEQD